MGIPLRQVATIGGYILKPAPVGPQALSARADARAAVPLQSRLRRLRQDRLSGRDPEQAHLGRRCARRRSTNAARRWSSIAGGEPLLHKELPQIVEGVIARKKFVIVCTNALLLEKKIDRVPAEPLLHLVDPSRRRPRDARPLGVPGGRLRQGRRGAQARQGEGFPRHHQLHVLQQRRCGERGALLRHGDGARRRRHHRVARLRLRARARPAAFPEPAPRPRSCSATSSGAAGAGKPMGRSTSRACSSISWPATRPITARRGATRPAPCSAGSGPATSSAKATPRPSRS